MLKDLDKGEWSEWRQLVFSELQRHDNTLSIHDNRVVKMEISVAKLNMVAAIFGAIGGIVITIVAQVIVGL